MFAFFGKTTPYGKIFNISASKFFTASLIDIVCSNFVKCCQGDRWNRALFTWPKQIRLPLKLATARIAPKICQSQPPNMCSKCSRFYLNRFTFGVHFCSIEYFHYRLFNWNKSVLFQFHFSRSHMWSCFRVVSGSHIYSPSAKYENVETVSASCSQSQTWLYWRHLFCHRVIMACS